MGFERQSMRIILVSLCLAGLTFAAFEQVRNHDFVDYDDDKYVTGNPQVSTGLSVESMKWAFTRTHASNWHPLTWLSHMLDCELFGLRPGVHHIVNLAIHIVATVVLFGVLQSMAGPGGFWPAAFVAAAFGIHPLHVESVAWIAERKDVLSGLFWMLTMAAYLWYARCGGVSRYLPVFVLFCLGLMAKPMLVTLPFVLLLLDYWPLKRVKFVGAAGREAQDEMAFRKASVGRLVIEKLPLLAASAASAVITYIVQEKSGAVAAADVAQLGARVSNAVVSYAAYLGKLAWPGRLACLYPLQAGGPPGRQVAIAAAVLAVISGVVFIFRRRRYLTVGWLWYLGTLVPVIGLVQVGAQAMADRYMYIPAVGVFIMVAWGGADVARRSRGGSAVLAALALAVLAGWLVTTRVQVGYWKDNLSLFSRVNEVSRPNYIMHNNLGNALDDVGRTDEAISHYRRALELRPDSAETHNNLGTALADIGQWEQAIEHYQKALQLRDDFIEARFNLAQALRQTDRLEEATAQYRAVLKQQPGNPDACNGIGMVLAERGEFEKAIEYYRRAISGKDDFAIARYNLGVALASSGRLDEAIEQFRRVLKIYPNDAEMHCNIAVLLERKGLRQEAIEELRTALRLDPNLGRARRHLENLLKEATAPGANENGDNE